MKLLRETIRNLMMENASIIDTSVIEIMQSNDLIFVVDAMPGYATADIFLVQRSEYDEEYKDIASNMGHLNAELIEADNTMGVIYALLDSIVRGQGVGKLMYNTLLAVCTQNDIWLMSDRSEVSAAAERIYDAWKESPSEYEIEQMDEEQPDETHHATLGDDYDPNVDFFLTKDRTDDVHHGSFHDSISNWSAYDDSDPRAQWGDMVKDWWYFFDDDYKEDFLASGLTKRFKMKDADSFIQALENNNLLYRINQ